MKKKPYRTNEVGRPGKFTSVEVFKTGKDGKGMRVEEGLWREMKEKYKLSTFQYPYVMLQDKDCTIAKLPILPSSLSNYWEYHDTFKKTDDEIWEFETVLKADDKVTKGSEGEYYLMTFKQGKKIEGEGSDLVVQTIKDLRDELKKVDEARDELKKVDEARAEQSAQNDEFREGRPANSFAEELLTMNEEGEDIDKKVDDINAEMAESKED